MQIEKFLVTTKTKKAFVILSFIYDDSPRSQEPGGSDSRMTLRHYVLGIDRGLRSHAYKLHRSFLRKSLRKRWPKNTESGTNVVENTLPLAHAHVYLIHRSYYTYRAFFKGLNRHVQNA